MNGQIPVALTIAGSDSSAGAGLQADLKTFQSFGVYGVCAVTCIVSELPGKVSRLEPVNAAMFRDQVELLLQHFPIGAAKTGLLSTEPQMRVLADVLSRLPGLSLVVDPVMIASSGDRLMDEEAQLVLESAIIPHARLVTPNLDEAAAFLGHSISSEAEMREAAVQLSQRWSKAVLLKGGHLAGEEAVDMLVEGDQCHEMRSVYLKGIDTHGTGCTLSAAIAAGLALGENLYDACREARRFVAAAMAQRHAWGDRNGLQLTALNHSASW